MKKQGYGRIRRRLALCVMVVACSDGGTAPDAFDPVAAFDDFWATFDAGYSYFDYKRIDWAELRRTHRPQAANAGTPDALVAVLREMTAPLRDVHVTFTNPAGETVPSWIPAHVVNWDRPTWSRHISGKGWQQRPNWGFARLGDIGYIAIGGWTEGVAIASVDSVLEQFRDLPALILDVRPNGGGDDGIALRVAGRFAAARIPIGSVRFRDGPRHSDFGPRIERYLEPRGPWTYGHAVVVLSGRAVYSSNETFIAAMRELPHVTVIGDTTGGGSGNPANHTLVGGWTYRVPRWVAYLVDGTVIEWNGIPPDIPLSTPDLRFGGESDPVLEFAEAWLRARINGG